MLLPPLSDTRRGNGALILVVLITIAIVLYLMFGMNSGGSGSTSKPGGGSYMGQVAQTRKQGRETANEISTQQLSILIAQYRQEHNGQLPKTPADVDGSGVFNDQWGHEMTFSFEENKKTGKTTVKYHSNGPDGDPGTEDDITRTDVLPF